MGALMKQMSWGITVGLKRPRRQPGGPIPCMELRHQNTIPEGTRGIGPQELWTPRSAPQSAGGRVPSFRAGYRL